MEATARTRARSWEASKRRETAPCSWAARIAAILDSVASATAWMARPAPALELVPGGEADDLGVRLLAVEEPPGVFREVLRRDRDLGEGTQDDGVVYRLEEVVLAAEVRVDEAGADACELFDAVHAGPGAVGGELRQRGLEELLPFRLGISGCPAGSP
jgi:hypothetical protein